MSNVISFKRTICMRVRKFWRAYCARVDKRMDYLQARANEDKLSK